MVPSKGNGTHRKRTSEDENMPALVADPGSLAHEAKYLERAHGYEFEESTTQTAVLGLFAMPNTWLLQVPGHYSVTT